MIIDRLDHEQKAEIVGRLFEQFILNKIQLDDFLRLAIAVEKTYLTDLAYIDIRYNIYADRTGQERLVFLRKVDEPMIKANLASSGLLSVNVVEKNQSNYSRK